MSLHRLPVLLAFGLLGTVLLWGFAQSFAVGQSSPVPRAQQAKLDDKRASVLEYRAADQTLQEKRAIAADRLQAVIEETAADLGVSVEALLAATAAEPGGTPDYFGVANWANSPRIRKFVDKLPGLDLPNNLGNSIPVAVPDTVTYPGSDYYELEVRQFTQKLHSDLPPTTLRGYVQTNYGTDADGDNTIKPAPIMYLGPMIVTQKDRPVRIKFTNMLPLGEEGDLFIPVDTTVMGAGMGPIEDPMMPGMREEYTQNRAVIHLHGGHTPWISDGSPHQWITPAGEMTSYPKGVSAQNVPDMPDPGEGAQTYYYTNQQSSRLLFYHDHSWGITRLNVYAGEAAGYLIRDKVEQDLIDRKVIPKREIALMIEDKTFVNADTVRATDPTWNWGSGQLDPVTGYREPKTGDLWYPHVYVPAQNPYNVDGVNPWGRWHYGPWFWPPTRDAVQPVPNPYYDPINAPWEPPEAPGVPDLSIPGESFQDTPLVNGVPYPKLTVEPKAYRFRILNNANDRFWNLQLYVADPKVVTKDGRRNTEVRMVPASPTLDLPANWPTDGREGGVPDPTRRGPRWIQIGTEGGFLPAPAVVKQQPITWNRNPTTFNAGNVEQHSLLLGTAERADVIIDFSKFAGKTLILYNDAPAAFPALDPRYDYYTGNPDLREEGGTNTTKAGYGPNTRTILQIRVKDTTPAAAFNLDKLQAEFASTPGDPGVFARGQNNILVGQSSYDSTYGKTFPTEWPLWGYSRIQDNAMQFTTVEGETLELPMKPKAIQDEMGEAYDEYGRMSGKLGLELPLTSSLTQNFVLQNYVDPVTEVIEDSMTPMSPVLGDGTQIWKITHNGVDTHTIHFHLYDVQLLNRVGWDGAIRIPDDNELGWKDTIRVSPLEDTIVALRATSSKQPFGQPDSIRPLNPAEPIGSLMGFTNLDPTTGQPLPEPTVNALTDFGWEYVWHCHILSHEEMDMMRPVKFNVARELAAQPFLAAVRTEPGGAPVVDLTWTDATPWDGIGPKSTLGDPSNEQGFRIERADVVGGVPGDFAEIGRARANRTHFTDGTIDAGGTYLYRVIVYNVAGDTVSNAAQVGPGFTAPAAPSGLTGSLQVGPQVDLQWTDESNVETGFVISRSVDGGPYVPLDTLGIDAVAYSDTTVSFGSTYDYVVQAVNGADASLLSNTARVVVSATIAAPSELEAKIKRNTTAITDTVTLYWVDNDTNEVSQTIERATDAAFTTGLTTFAVGTDVVAAVDTVAHGDSYFYRAKATGVLAESAWSNVASIETIPATPTSFRRTARTTTSIKLGWNDVSSNETGYRIQRRRPGGTWATVKTTAANATSWTNYGLVPGRTYEFRIRGINALGSSPWAPVVRATTLP